MQRRKRLVLNTATAFINQIVTLLSGFIIPRLIIQSYGSSTNGLVTSITQFLAFFAMTEMGVGAVVRSALYKPVAEGNEIEISKVLISSKRFFNRIGLLLCAYSVLLMVYFPLSVDHSIGYIATAVLVGSIAFNSVANYLLGIIYRQLLNSDQKAYIQFCICIATTVLNTIVSILLIRNNTPIQIVKLVASFVFLLNPLLMKLYVEKHYRLNLKLKLTEEPLKQKWNGLAQHIANYVLKHTDTMLLTWFSSLENVSIYYVYHLVANGLQQVMDVMLTGVSSLLGNMYAKDERILLNKAFNSFEMISHFYVTFLYSVAAVLIVPFVKVYMRGVQDANYIVPVFAILIVVANGSYCIRMPYETMIQVAGHFKETQVSSVIEASLNIIISLVLVRQYGLIGVAIGTLVAMVYRSFYLAWYLNSNILFRKFSSFIKHIVVDVILAFVIWVSTKGFVFENETWMGWVLMSIEVTVIAFAESVVVFLLIYRSQLIDCCKFLFSKQKRMVK